MLLLLFFFFFPWSEPIMLSDILDPPAFRRSRSSRSKRCGPNSKVPAPFDPSKVMGHLGDLTELRALVNRAIPFEPMQIGDPRIGQSDEKPVGCSEEVEYYFKRPELMLKRTNDVDWKAYGDTPSPRRFALEDRPVPCDTRTPTSATGV